MGLAPRKKVLRHAQGLGLHENSLSGRSKVEFILIYLASTLFYCHRLLFNALDSLSYTMPTVGPTVAGS